MKADDILRQAADIIEERGKLRDNAEGKRSMARAVSAYTALRGTVMESELDGWIFMCVLKLARATAGASHLDDFSDLAGYAALARECISAEPSINSEPSLHFKNQAGDEAVTKFPWSNEPAPSWARWAAQDRDGSWWAYKRRPYMEIGLDSWRYEGSGRVKRITDGLSEPVENWQETLIKLDGEGRPCPASTSAS